MQYIKQPGATSECIRKKIVDKIVKTKPVIDENSRNGEEIVFRQRKKSKY